jgi:hypothetical protein
MPHFGGMGCYFAPATDKNLNKLDYTFIEI